MSYTNGIGSPQQFPAAAEIAASSSVRTAKTGPGSVAAQDRFSQSSQVDAATLSAAASTFAQALSGGDVRSEKVAGLQQSILAGTYSVPVSDVAAKVLNALLQ